MLLLVVVVEAGDQTGSLLELQSFSSCVERKGKQQQARSKAAEREKDAGIQFASWPKIVRLSVSLSLGLCPNGKVRLSACLWLLDESQRPGGANDYGRVWNRPSKVD